MDERAFIVHENCLAYWRQINTVALPKALEDLAYIERVRQNEAIVGDRLATLVFRDRRLLKAARKRARQDGGGKRVKTTTSDDDSEDNSDDDGDSGDSDDGEAPHTFAVSSSTQKIYRGWNTSAPIELTKFTWDRAAVDDLQRRAREHLSYLRRLRNRTWSGLTFSEHGRIIDYQDRMTRWCARIASGEDALAYELSATLILEQLVALSDKARAVTAELHEVRRSVVNAPSEAVATIPVTCQAVDVTRPPAVSTFPPPSRADIVQSVGAVTSPEHVQVAELFKQLQALADRSRQQYGDVHYTGQVVVSTEVRSQPPLERPANLDVREDPWVASGLICVTCGIMRVIDEHQATAVCLQCGVSVPYQSENGCNFDDQPAGPARRTKNYSPKNYARQWLYKVQGKLRIDVPEAVWQSVFVQCTQRSIRVVNHRLMRTLLKLGSYSNYYSAVPFLTYRFNGVPLADFTPDEEHRLLEVMFPQAVAAYATCPPHIRRGRKSFISYAFFFNRSVLICGWPKYERCFPLLEGRPNLLAHDAIWQWICEQNEWPFRATA